MSAVNGHAVKEPSCQHDVTSGWDAGPLPEKVPLEDDVVVVSAEALPQKAEFRDPYKLFEDDEKGNGKKWSESTIGEKILSVSWIIVRIILVLGFLYLFIVALDIMGAAFQLISGRTAGSVLGNSILADNMIAGMMMGVLITVLLQSSSSTTSITVTMVGAGMLTVRQAIPIIMGANIGTSVTSTLVSLAQSSDRDSFRRAFAGASVHTNYNWLTVLVLLPIEAASGMLYHMTSAMVRDFPIPEDTANPQFLNVITDPLTDLICQIDRGVITAIALGTDRSSFPLARLYCSEESDSLSALFLPEWENSTSFAEYLEEEVQFAFNINSTLLANGSTLVTWREVNHEKSEKCNHLFAGCGTEFGSLSEAAGGTILLFVSLALMVICLLLMVKLLNSLLHGTASKMIKVLINADFPGKLSWLTAYVVMLAGAIMTFLVQSSSVFTSTVTPLVGMGIITVDRNYPLVIGSNVGTTLTSFLAAFTSSPDTITESIQVALVHLFFNFFGLLLFYPIPFMRNIPLNGAKFMGDVTARYRWFAVAFLVFAFFLAPMLVFALSLAGWFVPLIVIIPSLLVIIFVAVVKTMQSRCPGSLPGFLQTWDFLPLACRSLEPYDRVCTACCRISCCQKYCTSCQVDPTLDDILLVVSGEVLEPSSPEHAPMTEILKGDVPSEALPSVSGSVPMSSTENQGVTNPAYGAVGEIQTKL